jgi:hypothetical protein
LEHAASCNGLKLNHKLVHYVKSNDNKEQNCRDCDEEVCVYFEVQMTDTTAEVAVVELQN